MRVWVARAEPAASQTAARLHELGHDPLVAPVLDIVPTGNPSPAGPFDAILLTSANAVAPLAEVGWRGTTIFAVGRRTAEAARAAGLGPIIAGDGAAAALAALIAGTIMPGARLLHVAGETRKAEPSESLRRRGYGVTTWVAYAAEPVAALPGTVADSLAAGAEMPLCAVLHYSRRSAVITLRLVEAAGLDRSFRQIRHFCLSADVAIPLVEAGIPAHFVPERPDEASLLAGLAQSP